VPYKVLYRRSDGSLWSWVDCMRHEKPHSGYLSFVREYRVGEWTKPAEGTEGLFCFDTLDAAFTLVDNWGSSRFSIYECEVQDAVLITDVADWLYPKDWLLFWELYPIPKWGSSEFFSLPLSTCGIAPCGSLLCSAIMITKQVWPEGIAQEGA